jgi:diguanylate cyclase (GGDEF)-like protein
MIKIQQNIINYEKKGVKKDVENFKIMFNIFFDTSYDLIYFNLENFLKIVIEREIKNFYVTKDNSIIYGDVTNKKLNYEIYKNRYVILDYKNKKYLVFLLDKNKKVYLAGINKKLIDEIILENIKKYLDFINKNNPSYIALGKILTFNPAKNGKFGYLYYMPPKLKEKEGMILSIYKPDSKGNFFRKRYFNCLKENKSCFVSYYFKNPKTGKIEEKISYFTLLKPFNFDVVKGIYNSQIREQLKLEIEKIKKIIKKIVVIGFLVYFILLFVFYIYLNVYANKMKNKIFKQYENLIEELKTKHYYDDLTKLPNRNKLIENLKNYKGLILIDIDDFSDINDVYGFFTGNKILKSIADELNEIYKNVYRTGSDEFVIGFNRKIYKTDLCGIANREFQYKFIKLTFTVSGSNEEKVLLKTAESALKLAKKTQKNCILFNKDIEEAQKNRIRLIQKLRKVLENNKIIPFYQCIKGKEEKYESLMRIEMDNKIIPPFMFMDLLKEAKLYNKFSQIMIEKVFNDLKNNKIKNVSINLSYIDIVNEDTRNFIFNLIENCKKNNEITFEILESESIGNFDIVKNFIQFVKNKGIKIAIDDFGSGYSNYIRILELQPDFIKIDGSLIINISDKKYYEIVRLIVQFAKEFNIATVAEFVENEEIYNILKNIGIDYFQGYYFCKPEPIEKIKI